MFERTRSSSPDNPRSSSLSLGGYGFNIAHSACAWYPSLAISASIVSLQYMQFIFFIISYYRCQAPPPWQRTSNNRPSSSCDPPQAEATSWPSQSMTQGLIVASAACAYSSASCNAAWSTPSPLNPYSDLNFLVYTRLVSSSFQVNLYMVILLFITEFIVSYFRPKVKPYL